VVSGDHHRRETGAIAKGMLWQKEIFPQASHNTLLALLLLLVFTEKVRMPPPFVRERFQWFRGVHYEIAWKDRSLEGNLGLGRKKE
jgi:hypothetical protein